jgi:anti-sigma regulatory factor (Ser/Thr protein kinase)
MRRALRKFLAAIRLERTRHEDVVLAAGEAIANAIEHAYRGGDGEVRLRVFTTTTRVVVEVSDRGRWRLEGDAERGRGLCIMRALVDHVVIESEGSTRTLALRAALVTKGAAASFAAV